MQPKSRNILIWPTLKIQNSPLLKKAKWRTQHLRGINCAMLCTLKFIVVLVLSGQFGALAWSPDCSKLVYVADAKPPKTSSFFSSKLGRCAQQLLLISILSCSVSWKFLLRTMAYLCSRCEHVIGLEAERAVCRCVRWLRSKRLLLSLWNCWAVFSKLML